MAGSCEVDGAEDCTACDTGYTLNGQVCDGMLSLWLRLWLCLCPWLCFWLLP